MYWFGLKTDEEILNHYFNKQQGLRKMPSGVSHFGGYIKPWESVVPRFHSIKHIFTKASKEEFLSIFDNLFKKWFYINCMKSKD